jgi:hypothetical protein
MFSLVLNSFFGFFLSLQVEILITKWSIRFFGVDLIVMDNLYGR